MMISFCLHVITITLILNTKKLRINIIEFDENANLSVDLKYM